MDNKEQRNSKQELRHIYNQTRMAINSSLKPSLPKQTTAFSTQSSSLKTQMANNTETVAVKTEFVNVVTEGELLLSPISATFSTIVTEASLVEIPPTEGPINEKSITTLYDEVFIDAMSYQAFTENKLRPWENTLEYKHFDTMYTNYRSLVNTIRKLCKQAQMLLEEADILTGRDSIL